MRRVFLSLVLRIKGNVNADESRGNRITIKKIYSSDGSIRPFVSARAVRRAIRERLMDKGFEVDPLAVVGGQGGPARLQDIGDPVKFVDDDIFGYLAIKRKKRGRAGEGEAGEGIPRKSPVKVSYLMSMKHAEVVVERGGRFPRPHTPETIAPTPFEIEVADFIGLLNVIVEDRIGVFARRELKDDVINAYKEQLLTKGGDIYMLDRSQRLERSRALFEILIKEGWVFPRASTSLNYSEYFYGVIVSSEFFIPLGGFVDITDDSQLDLSKISNLIRFHGDKIDHLYVVDYRSGKVFELDKSTLKLVESSASLNDIIEEMTTYLIQ